MTAQLSNPDLDPVPPSGRTWTATHIASLWIGMAVCIPTYMLASSLMDTGMSWKEAVATVAIGNLIVLVPMMLTGHAGARYGIPFPVLARASFGVLGANIPAMLRAVVACGWFGIQTWIGGQAIYQLAKVIYPASLGLPQPLTSFLGIGTGPLAGFVLFWLMNVYFVWKGTESIKWMETLSAPFLIVVGLALLGWAYMNAGGFGPILAQPSRFTSWSEFFPAFFPALTAMVGFWATLSLNIPDFTRYARSQRDQVMGQALGLPTTMTLFSLIGVTVSSATMVIFHLDRPIWDPVVLLGKIGGVGTTLLAMLALVVATISTNIAANVVSPANDFSNLAPSKISYRMGGMVTAMIGLLMFPWKLIESSHGYIFTWLIGYSALLGPIGGILIADYCLLRRSRLNVDDLYRRGGEYEYRGGFNPIALYALAIGVAVNVPGFVAEAFPSLRLHVPEFLRTLYSYAWFVGFFISGLLYWASSHSSRLMALRQGDSLVNHGAARSSR